MIQAPVLLFPAPIQQKRYKRIVLANHLQGFPFFKTLMSSVICRYEYNGASAAVVPVLFTFYI